MLNKLTNRLYKGLLIVGITLSVGVMSVFRAQGQTTNERSPYSRYGFGTMTSNATTGARGMGGLGYGLRDKSITNPLNPASYSAVDSMTFIFDLGLSAKISWLREGSASDKRTLGNLEYMTALFPVSKGVGVSLGVMPISRTGYRFGSLVSLGGDENTDSYQRSYAGNGTYNRVYLGTGVRLFDGLSLGANVGYIFGTITHQRYVSYMNSTADNQMTVSSLRLRGLNLDFGAQYEMKLDSLGGRLLTLGASLSPNFSDMLGEHVLERRIVGSTATEIVQSDTTSSRGYSLPLSLGFGASYRKVGSFMVGADLQYSGWKRAKYENLEARFRNQLNLRLGGEWIPEARSRSLWKKARYRAGLTFSTAAMEVPVGEGSFAGYNEYGASLGLGLPLVDRRSDLNFSIDYKHLSPKISGMVSEHYVGLTLGITFNEGWFRRARAQ